VYASDIASDIPETSARRLLLKAIRSLPDDEQDRVLDYVIGRALEPESRSGFRQYDPASAIAQGTLKLSSAPGGELRTVPVRFPAPLYRRLRAWCTANNFPMAVVIRGLVERFLDDQDRRSV
jgi:hypothetical protein